VTDRGLVFIGAAMDNYLRAFDIETGRELWKGRLPAGGQATPMTYRSTENGRQFVVIAAGGHGRLGTDIGDSVVAFALPDTGADVLKQATARTLRTAGILLILSSHPCSSSRSHGRTGCGTPAGNSPRDRDLVGMAGKSSHAGNRACVVRSCRDRLAVKPWAQSQVEEVAGMRCATTLLDATGFVISGRSFSARVIRETAHARTRRFISMRERGKLDEAGRLSAAQKPPPRCQGAQC
jgi:PQQ enzyme repeat